MPFKNNHQSSFIGFIPCNVQTVQGMRSKWKEFNWKFSRLVVLLPSPLLHLPALACIHTVGILGQSEPLNGWQWLVILQWKLNLFELNWKGPESENLALSEVGSFVCVLGRSDRLSRFNGDLNFELWIPAFIIYQNHSCEGANSVEFDV